MAQLFNTKIIVSTVIGGIVTAIVVSELKRQGVIR